MAQPRANGATDDKEIDPEIRAIFDRYDLDKSGHLNREEVVAALGALEIPEAIADDVMERVDLNQDGRIDISEFSCYVESQDEHLRMIFNGLDEDKSGYIKKKEVLDRLHRLGYYAASEKDAKKMIARLDITGDGMVNFSEFRTAFALLRPVDILRVFEYENELFDSSSAGEISDIKATLPTALVSSTTVAPVSTYIRLLTAGVSAVIAQTCLQPVETVKVRLQNEANLKEAQNKRYRNLVRGMRIIYNEEGIFRGLYKGMLPSAMREMVYSSIRFGAYVPIKNAMGCDDPRNTPFWKKLASGGLAGGIGSFISNPTDLLKIRMQAVVGNTTKTMTGHCKDIWAEGGVRGFYTGAGATVTRAVVLGATKLACYDEYKVLFHDHVGLSGVQLQVTSSACTAFTTAVTSAPADFVRTRVMTAKQLAVQTGVEVQYRNGFDVIKQVLRKEGPLAMYKGFWPQFARIAPYSVIQFTIWEQLSKLVGSRVT